MSDQPALLIVLEKNWSKSARDAAAAARKAGAGHMAEVKNDPVGGEAAPAAPNTSTPPKNRKEAMALSDKDLAYHANQEAIANKRDGTGGYDRDLTTGTGPASTEFRSRQNKSKKLAVETFFKDKTPAEVEAITADVRSEMNRALEAQEKRMAGKGPDFQQPRGNIGYAVMMTTLQRKYKVPKGAASQVGTALGLTDMMFSG